MAAPEPIDTESVLSAEVAWDQFGVDLKWPVEIHCGSLHFIEMCAGEYACVWSQRSKQH